MIKYSEFARVERAREFKPELKQHTASYDRKR
jgi:hypothetical protein